MQKQGRYLMLAVKRFVVLMLLVAALAACNQTEITATATAVPPLATAVPAEPDTTENSTAVLAATAVPEEAPVTEPTPNTRPYAGTVPAPDFPPRAGLAERGTAVNHDRPARQNCAAGLLDLRLH
jgi:hypothetical protein